MGRNTLSLAITANGCPSQMTAEEMQVMESKSLEVKFQKELVQLECGHETRCWMQKHVHMLHAGAESDPED